MLLPSWLLVVIIKGFLAKHKCRRRTYLPIYHLPYLFIVANTNKEHKTCCCCAVALGIKYYNTALLVYPPIYLIYQFSTLCRLVVVSWRSCCVKNGEDIWLTSYIIIWCYQKWCDSFTTIICLLSSNSMVFAFSSSNNKNNNNNSQQCLCTSKVQQSSRRRLFITNTIIAISFITTPSISTNAVVLDNSSIKVGKIKDLTQEEAEQRFRDGRKSLDFLINNYKEIIMSAVILEL